MKNLIGIFIFISSLAFMLYFCISLDHDFLTVEKKVDNRTSYYIHDINTRNAVSLSLLCFWTFFWHCLLIWLLQHSPHIVKSAVFLFQQTLLVQLMSFVLHVGLVYYSFFYESILPNRSDSDIDLMKPLVTPWTGLLLTQQLNWLLFILLEYLQTFEMSSIFNILYIHKCFYFIFSLTAFYFISFSFNIINSALYFLGTLIAISLFLLILNGYTNFILHQKSSIASKAFWLTLILLSYYTIFSTLVLKGIVDYLIPLPGPILMSMSVTLIDGGLRKEYFKLFNDLFCCCCRLSHSNSDQHSVRNIEGGRDGIRTEGQQEFSHGDHVYHNAQGLSTSVRNIADSRNENRTEAHGVREDDPRSMPHQAPELDDHCAAHSATPLDPYYDVTKGAHGPRPQILGKRKSDESEKVGTIERINSKSGSNSCV